MLRIYQKSSNKVYNYSQRVFNLGISSRNLEPMIKFVLIFFTFLGIAFAPPTKDLKNDFKEILALIPLDEINAIISDYLANDPEVQEFAAFIESDNFQRFVTSYKNSIDSEIPGCSISNAQKLDLEEGLQFLYDFLHNISYGPGKNSSATGGLGGLVDDIIQTLPLYDMQDLIEQKMENNSDFKAEINCFRGLFTEEFYEMKAIPEYKEVLDRLSGYGFNIEALLEFCRITGNCVPTKDLNDDLNDFLALVPVDEIVSIVMKYVTSDPEVQQGLVYLQSSDFETIVESLEQLEEFGKFVHFLDDHGLQIQVYINEIHQLFGWDPYQVPQTKKVRRQAEGKGFNGLICGIIALIPLDKLKALFEEKLQTSPDFKQLYDTIRGPEFQGMLDTLRAMPEYQNLLENLRGYGVDVDHYIKLLRALFGINGGAPQTKNLDGDINELLAILPVDQILAIILDYLVNDTEVQEAWMYFMSGEFEEFLASIECSFSEKLIAILEEIKHAAGSAKTGESGEIGEGLTGMLNAIVAILPLDKIEEFVPEKMETSGDFRTEITCIQDWLKSLIELPTPSSQPVLDKLRGFGIDVDLIAKLMNGVVGQN